MDWNKVKDEKPKHSKLVLIYPPRCGRSLAWYEKGKWYQDSGYDNKLCIVEPPDYWAEYAPPKEE